MEEGDSQPAMKSEPIEEQDNIGDSANVSQEKSASSGSEGSDGFVKLDELEDAQPASPEVVEDIPVQSDVQASEEFTKLTPSTDISKGSLETKMNAVEDEQKSSENDMQEAEDDVAVGDVVGSGDVPRTLSSVDDVLDVEKPVAMTKEEDAVESCKLTAVLPTSIERGRMTTASI